MDNNKLKEIIKNIQNIFEAMKLIILALFIVTFIYTSVRIKYQYQILDIIYFLLMIIILFVIDNAIEYAKVNAIKNIKLLKNKK